MYAELPTWRYGALDALEKALGGSPRDQIAELERIYTLGPTAAPAVPAIQRDHPDTAWDSRWPAARTGRAPRI